MQRQHRRPGGSARQMTGGNQHESRAAATRPRSGGRPLALLVACSAAMIMAAAPGLAPPAATAAAARAPDAAMTASSWQARPGTGAVFLREVFTGVSCAVPAACVAVGLRISGQGTRPLAERWDGRRWVIVTVPAAASMTAVSCPARTACTAIGTSRGVVAWNGTTWAVQRVPGQVNSAALHGVSCTSRRACTAVGYHTNEDIGEGFTLADRWNGTRWARQPAAWLSPSQLPRLVAVSCGSRSACVAVGDYHPASGTLVPLAESWNGSAWTITPTPALSPAQPVSTLDGVWCGPAGTCIAVGGSYDRGAFSAIAEGWDGSAWTVQPGPSQPYELTQVSCSSASACTAIGYRYAVPPGTGFQALTERWNGTAWAVQPNPPASGNVFLAGISCPAAASCTAVGFRVKANGNETLLAEHWNGTDWATQRTPAPQG